MLKPYFCLLLLLTLTARAQQEPPRRTCGTEEANARQQAWLQRTVPGYDPARRTSPAPAAAWRTEAVTYTVPVIVHVIHNGEAVGTGSNISAAQVQSQLDVLNEDYRNLNADGSSVPSAFQSVRGDAQLQFVAARRNPSGTTLAEPGIDRVNRNTNGWTAPPYTQAYTDATIKPATSWDPERYLNIWLENLGNGLLGYAQFPDNTAGLSGLNASGGSANTDGVVILYSAFGSRAKYSAGTYGGTSYDKGRSLTHELGHFFGLRHIWGDGTCADDYVADTPTQNAANYGCPTYPHVTCSNGAAGDQFMNYMDYGNDACIYMFSQGQVGRVQAVMAAGTPRRTALATSTVGCVSIAAATAANNGPACAGGSLTLTATGPAGATYAWSGPGGYASTLQNPVLGSVTAAMSGAYTVKVTSSTAACPGTASTTVLVNALPTTPTLTTTATAVCPGSSATLGVSTPTGTPLSESFDGTAPGWTVSNAGATGTDWQLRASPYSYNAGFQLSNFTLNGSRFILANSDVGGSGSTTNTTLTSPAFSTLGYATLQLSLQQVFYVDGSGTGSGLVEASTDGSTWTTLITYTTAQGTIGAPDNETLNLNAYANKSSVQLRWRYLETYGYFWALDNVAVTGTLASPTYAWSLVSGDGLPGTTNAATLTVTPTVNSVYRLTVGNSATGCAASNTSSVAVASPTWSGAAGNSRWDDAGNWSPGCIPSRTTDAVIPAGRSSYPVLNSTTLAAEVRSLTVASGATLTQSAGSLSVYGSFTNQAGTGVGLTGGAVVLRGAAATLTGATTFYDLQVNLSSAAGTATLASAATVTHTLTMTQGLLAPGANALTLGSAATLSETDASYVLGRLSLAARPLAAGTAQSFGGIGLTLTPAAGSTSPGSTTVTRVTGTALTGVSGSQSVLRYFDIVPSTNTGLNVQLDFTYWPHEQNGIPVANLVLYKSTTGTSGPWLRQAGTTASGSTITKTGISDFSIWTLGNLAAPLPVTLARFEATRQGPDALLSWTTASELSNQGFEVQASPDGSTYRALGFVAGAGSSTAAHDYRFVDAEPGKAGPRYYRLRQLDLGGTVSFSPVRVVQFDASRLLVQAQPNPFGSQLTLSLHLLTAGSATIELRDALGRLVLHRALDALPAGPAQAELPGLDQLPAGLYLLRVTAGGASSTAKVVRE